MKTLTDKKIRESTTLHNLIIGKLENWIRFFKILQDTNIRDIYKEYGLYGFNHEHRGAEDTRGNP